MKINASLLSVAIIFLMLSNPSARGQIQVTTMPEVTAIDLVETILGGGIEYSNVQYQGADIAGGVFINGDSTNLGLNKGVFLTSGAGENIPGPNQFSSSSSMNGQAGHPLLNSISTSITYDASVLEFDFIPQDDTIKIRYVFGGEAYNETVNTSFNDLCGIFVSGMNPNGGFYSDTNIAVVPGTNLSVCVNNINNGYSQVGIPPGGPCEHCEYYNDNTGGQSLEYDGFTTVLTAKLAVIPFEEYHLFIGTADAGDQIDDCGIFVEANSIGIPTTEFHVMLNPQGQTENLVEGHIDADLIIELPEEASSDTTICFDIGGTAEMGVDYSWIDNCVTIQAGYDTAMVHIHPFYDGIIEGDETIKFTIANKMGKSKSYDSTEVVIEDYLNMTSSTNTDPFICAGQLTPLWVSVSNGYPPYTYYWEPGSFINDTIFVDPEETTLYTVNVIDHLQDTVADQVTVNVLPVDLNEINSFSFKADNNPGLSEDLTGQIFEDSVFVAIPENVNMENLVATFDISYCSEAMVNGNLQQSGITPNDFTEQVIYEVTAQNGDVKEWMVIVDLVNGMDERKAREIKVFPNPVIDKLVIRNAKSWKLEMLNPVGVSLSQTLIKDSQILIDVSDLDAGIYLLHFVKGESETMQRVVITR